MSVSCGFAPVVVALLVGLHAMWFVSQKSYIRDEPEV